MARCWSHVLMICVALTATAAAAEEPVELLGRLSDGATVELPEVDPEIPSPAEFLGYPLGDRFTHHERIVEYLSRLDEASDRVVSWEYGRTYEGRPLKLLAISHPDNLARLDELRREQLALADPRRLEGDEGEAIVGRAPVVVWLAYGVHGNESSSAEAAMAAAWALAAARGEAGERLRRAVVILDPLVNPDGRERYVHFYETRRGREPDPEPLAAEHWEAWPGGRQNHYLVDLNRDWAWQSQLETRARLAAYRRWEPQVYVDYHEMGSESTYFFPPAAEPIHPRIGRETVDWLDVFGRANAAAFDRQGWVYYVGERFDLFYPGYGDAYPALRGAVGMTYEMAGHGFAGQAIERRDGSLLTLADRVARHLTTSLATVGAAIEHREKLVADFLAGRRRALAKPEKLYLFERSAPEARAAVELLAAHGIEVRQLTGASRLEARLQTGEGAETRSFAAGTYLVSSRQPLGSLVGVLMDLTAEMPASFLEEQRRRLDRNLSTDFYDITAWSLPVSFGLEVWEAEGGAPAAEPATLDAGAVHGEGAFGFLVPPQGVAGYRFAAGLVAADVRFRLALRPFELGGRAYPDGTLFVPTRGNPEDLESRIEELAGSAGVEVRRTASGYSERGLSMGSDSMPAIGRARIGLVGGSAGAPYSGVSPTSFGGLWHLFDRLLELPHHRIELTTLPRLDLSELDVLVLPDARNLDRVLDEEATGKIGDWVRSGGILVAVEGSVSWLQERELTEVGSWRPEEGETPTMARDVPATSPADRPIDTPGAALATELGGPHPLLAGVPAPPPALFQGKTVLLPSGDPQRDLLVARREDPVISGFAWPEAAERLAGALLVGVESHGAGTVVLFAQEPVFRLFWRSTAPLLLNAVLYGPYL